MNILYIGPYKDISIDGISSRYLINNLRDMPSINLTIQNIIISSKADNSLVYSEETIKSDLESYDVVIQHAPIDFIVSDSRIKKSIIIPIMDSLNEKNINKLKVKKFNKLLVNNKCYLDKLKKIFGSKIICLRYNNIIQPINRKYSIRFLNNTKKFYYIGNYIQQQSLVRKTILSFMMAFRTDPSTSLVLFLSDNQSDLEQLNKDMEDYKKQLNLINDCKKITVAPFNSTEESLSIAHNGGDIYISPIVSNSNIHCEIAQAYKKKILYLDRIDSVSVPADKDYRVGDNISSPVTLSVVAEMKKISSDDHKSQYFLCDSKYIKDIIIKL